MKKLKLVSRLFCFMIILPYQIAFSQSIVLNGDTVKFDALEKAVNERNNASSFSPGQSFRVTLAGGRIYYLSSSTILSGVKPVRSGYPGGRGYCEFDFYNTK